MRGRSSIFSFDTLAVRPRPGAALLWCVVFLAAFRLLLAAAPDAVARQDIRNATAYLHDAGAKELRVVFFGSSRMESAIVPTQWARRAGLRLDQVANLAVNDGHLWDALHILRRAGGLPASVELVVIEVPTWNFNRNVLNALTRRPAIVPEHFRSWATLADRLAVDDPASRLHLLADYLWPTYQRRPLDQWQWNRTRAKPHAPDPPAYHLDESLAARIARRPAFQGRNIAAQHFFQPELSGFAKRNLDLLVARTRNDSRKIVLLQLPARQAYLRAIERDPAKRNFHRKVERLIRSHESKHVATVLWDRAEDCGLTEDIFLDYGHLSAAGAGHFTARLFEELTRRGINARTTSGS